MIEWLSRRSAGTLLGALGVAALLGVGAVTAQAQPKDASNVGTLRCKIAGGGSFIVGSSRNLDCVYAPRRGANERYRGKIRQFGLDIGPVARGRMIWTVWAPGSGKKGRGRLAGRYRGYGGQVAVIKGVGYQNLLFGPNFNLMPASFTGLTGVNIALGVKSMRLEYAGR